MMKSYKNRILKTTFMLSIILISMIAVNRNVLAASKEGKDVYQVVGFNHDSWHTVSGYQFKYSPPKELYYRKDSKSKSRCINPAPSYAYVYRDGLYYTLKNELYFIDLKTDKKTKLYNVNQDYRLMIHGIIGDKIYLEKIREKSKSVLIYSIKKKKVISTIKTNSIAKNAEILGAVDDKLYYQTCDSIDVIDVDTGLNRGQTIDSHLYLYNPSTKKSKLISKHFTGASIIDDSIYYDVILKREFGREIKWALYKCDLNGSNKKKLKVFRIKSPDSYEITFDSNKNMYVCFRPGKIEVVGHGTFKSSDGIYLKYDYEKKTLSKSSEAKWIKALSSKKPKHLMW